jgi:hypothetical protein
MQGEGIAGTTTRHEFVLLAGGALAYLAAPDLARAARHRRATASRASGFYSRPDLKPPSLTVETRAPGIAPGYVFLAPILKDLSQGTALIADNAGRPVWIYQPDRLVMNFRAQSLAGKPVLTWWEGSVVNGFFEGECVIADSSYQVIHRLPGVNGLKPEVHEFLITARGTALISANNNISANLSSYGGPKSGTIIEGVVLEIDIASGKLLLEWHSLDHVALRESYAPAGPLWDYFHINAIDVDQDGNLLVSGRYPCAVYKLKRSSGAMIWRLGGKKSDFAIGEGARFWYQHDARSHPGGLLSLFDDGADDADNPPEKMSRAIVLVLDTKAMTAELAQAFQNPHQSLTTAMGNAQWLADRGCFVGWGNVPEFSEFGPDGSLRFDAFLPEGQKSYRGFRSPWTGAPADRPAAAVVRNANGSIDVYASWNGATAVSRWQVRGGSKAGSLAPLETVPRSGFETRVRIAHAPARVCAVALDRKGKPLGRSSVLGT